MNGFRRAAATVAGVLLGMVAFAAGLALIILAAIWFLYLGLELTL
jgi:hypothetical protein